jgi:hypothetical protein
MLAEKEDERKPEAEEREAQYQVMMAKREASLCNAFNKQLEAQQTSILNAIRGIQLQPSPPRVPSAISLNQHKERRVKPAH